MFEMIIIYPGENVIRQAGDIKLELLGAVQPGNAVENHQFIPV